MVDLIAQYNRIQSEVDNAVLDVIKSSAYINGPEVKQFETELADYLNASHVIPCANGTDALQIAMMALDLKPGDEVITTNFTFIATAEVIGLLQLTPVLVDVDPGTYNIDPAAIKAAITPRTKAIVPVHLFGQCAYMEDIMDIGEEYNLSVIEDTAQAIGADYIFQDGHTQKAGTLGHIGTTSFFPSKNLGCYGDGGAIMTNDDGLANRMRQVANHGMVKRYYHDFLGVNSRLDSIQAAVLRIKLRYLDDYASRRRAAADYYDQGFAGNDKITPPFRASFSTHVFHQYTLRLKDVNRFGLQEYLSSKDIPSMVYYPVPLHLQKAFKNDRYREGDFPVTESLSEEVISLPMHTELSREQQDLIIKEVLNFIEHENG